jgi:AraC-like DNA-binding protein
LDQVRFERARKLLADRRACIIDVAFELGYTDQSNFSRAFRRWAGISPGAYRQALMQEGEDYGGAPAITSTPKAASAAARQVAV